MKKTINIIIAGLIWSLVIYAIYNSIGVVLHQILGNDIEALKSAVQALWAIGVLWLADILDIRPL